MTPSSFYQYSFVSPEPLYALLREELASHFASGAVDDTLFPLWTGKVLQKLGRGMKPITHILLHLEDHEGALPPDFAYPREVWALSTITQAVQVPSAQYTLEETSCLTPALDCCLTCVQDTVKVVKKHQGTVLRSFQKSQLLRPGIIDPSHPCLFPGEGAHRFDVHDHKLLSTLEKADLYLVYYSNGRDEQGYQLIPDNVHIQEAVESFLKYKLFESLFNQASDETFNQAYKRKEDAEMDYNLKMVKAETETKKRSVQQTVDKITASYYTHRKYNIR